MKRSLVLFIAVMLGLVGYSQSVIIHFKDGSIEKHEMSLIESIEFVDDNYETSASIYLEMAGTLSSKLSKSQASELLKLKLSGHMDARDFDYIKWNCMKIEEVDLSDVVIDSYIGSDGTNEGYDASYEANEIPMGAFFYWVNSYKYNYTGRPSDEGMPSLKKIVLPQGIKAIRRNAFARAYNLTEINIPEGVESIDFVAFAICTSLEELKLPASLSTVGKQAFADMKSMKRFYVAANTPPTAYSNSFQGIPSDAVLYVPSGTENQYRNAVGWNTFTSIVGIGDNTNDAVGDVTTDDSEYFEITINGEKFCDDDVWGGSVLAAWKEKTTNGTKMIPYGGGTDMIHTSDGRAYQFQVFVGYVEGNWFGKGYPKSVGTYDVVSSEGEYVISNYSDNLGMVVRGGGSNNGPSDFVVKSGNMKITKVSKASSNEKFVPGKSELFATEGNFDFILHDKRYDEDIPMSGKFRLIY